ncbi:DNA-(apurinic or apyrimidinic site) lyase /endonuclease III [Natronincola peptidivorans]|uniref:Endonuclease III n=1 Tax=Natronincola peptidivorans TaxID=426128 RepID=A0A1I0DK02_9FIRM|nr:endonuclease III [Natronincola peptidivorans]SET32799.1 DNA-(apurinic or apyrimidinic site) lyase /endonuclease III [Natronincola peptidivorans]
MKKRMLSKEDVKEALRILAATYPDADTELNFHTPLELLIATILAAQCTDKRVNEITKELFKKFKSAEDYIELTEEELEPWIRSCGFYRNKSKNILQTCRIIVEKYNGEVPKTREELIKLPGVGRKTANVVISNVFGQDAIAVDTHVFRVSNRIGLANAEDVTKTEEQLMKNIPKKKWSEAHHWLIFHGRRICKARRPHCEKCPLTKICLYYKSLS